MLQIVQHNTSNQGCEMLERLFPPIRFLFSRFFFKLFLKLRYSDIVAVCTKIEKQGRLPYFLFKP